MGPEFEARFRKNLAENMAQGLAKSMAEQFEKKGMVWSEDLGSLKRELAKKVKKLALVMEGTPDAWVGEGVTSGKGSKVNVKGFINLKKKDEL
jgi:hypothetical protein